MGNPVEGSACSTNPPGGWRYMGWVKKALHPGNFNSSNRVAVFSLRLQALTTVLKLLQHLRTSGLLHLKNKLTFALDVWISAVDIIFKTWKFTLIGFFMSAPKAGWMFRLLSRSGVFIMQFLDCSHAWQSIQLKATCVSHSTGNNHAY